jgi:hypothetical protein
VDFIESQDLDLYIRRIQVNLGKIVTKANRISNEFRRTLSEPRSRKNLAILRELLETDNLIQDVVAQLTQAHSQIQLKLRPEELLQSKQFLESMYQNLLNMFQTFEKISDVIEIEELEIDNLVVETLDSLDQLHSFS